MSEPRVGRKVCPFCCIFITSLGDDGSDTLGNGEGPGRFGNGLLDGNTDAPMIDDIGGMPIGTFP
jgi:hypothetical protein